MNGKSTNSDGGGFSRMTTCAMAVAPSASRGAFSPSRLVFAGPSCRDRNLSARGVLREDVAGRAGHRRPVATCSAEPAPGVGRQVLPFLFLLVALGGLGPSAHGSDLPLPWLHLPLNEGQTLAISNVSGQPVKVDVIRPEGLDWVDGPDGKALYFRNGHEAAMRAALRCEMPAELDLSTGFTVAAMLKTPPELHRSRQYELFFFADTHTQGPGLRVYVSWRMLWLHVHDGAGSHTVRTRPARLGINPDTWYHVAATFDGDLGRIYLNGELQVEQSGMRMAMPLKRRQAAHVGASTTAGSGYGFEGVISHFMLFPQALSQEQVASLYLRH